MRYTGPTQYLVLLQDAYFRENRFELVATVKVVLLKFQKITRIEKKLNWTEKIEKNIIMVPSALQDADCQTVVKTSWIRSYIYVILQTWYNYRKKP